MSELPPDTRRFELDPPNPEVAENVQALDEGLEDGAETDVDLERRQALDRFIDKYFPDDKEFLEDMDEGDQIGYMYGVIQMPKEQLDRLFREAGIFE